MNYTSYIIPTIILFIVVYGLIKKVDIFNEFIEGAKENLQVGIDLLPTLICIVTVIAMFKNSGAVDIISLILKPLTDFLGFPTDCIPLALIRPISGSGALAVYENILTHNHPDSFVGKVASVMMGSTETTFYTIAVYFSVTKVKKIRHALFCALIGDFAGFIFSSLVVKLLYNNFIC